MSSSRGRCAEGTSPPARTRARLFSLLIRRCVRSDDERARVRWPVCRHYQMATGRCHRGIQHRRNRQHHSIALGIDPDAPGDLNGVDRQILQPRGIMSRTDAGSRCLPVWPGADAATSSYTDVRHSYWVDLMSALRSPARAAICVPSPTTPDHHDPQGVQQLLRLAVWRLPRRGASRGPQPPLLDCRQRAIVEMGDPAQTTRRTAWPWLRRWCRTSACR